MVSNDSKLPNSARNAIKFFLAAAAVNGGSGGSAAVFLKLPKIWLISDTLKKIWFQYLQKQRRSTEFKIYLD